MPKKYSARPKRQVRTMRKRPFRRRIQKRQLDIHHYKFKVNGNTLGSMSNGVVWGTNGAANNGNLVFQLDDIATYADIQELYDFYRINKVVVKFMPRFTNTTLNANYPNSASGTTSGDYFLRYLPMPPKFGICIDHNDSTNPATMDVVRQYAQSKIVNINKPITVKFTPSSLNMTYETVATTAYTPRYKQWISTTDPDVPHYCIKWYLDALSSTSSALDVEGGASACTVYDIEAIYYISAKAQR